MNSNLATNMYRSEEKIYMQDASKAAQCGNVIRLIWQENDSSTLNHLFIVDSYECSLHVVVCLYCTVRGVDCRAPWSKIHCPFQFHSDLDFIVCQTFSYFHVLSSTLFCCSSEPRRVSEITTLCSESW